MPIAEKIIARHLKNITRSGNGIMEEGFRGQEYPGRTDAISIARQVLHLFVVVVVDELHG